MESHFKPGRNARGGIPSGQDALNYLAFEPPMEFFTKAPKRLPAHFSTRMGARARRDPDMLPSPRKITPWTTAQIKQNADTIRTYCFPIFKHISQPMSYHDLHHYWDTVDLWESGVHNLWNVLNHIYWDTQRELPEITAEVRVCVEEWAGVQLRSPERQERLLKWDEDEDGYDILGVFQPEELKDLDGLDTFWLSLVRDVLKCARGHIRRGTYSPPYPTAHKPAPSSETKRENNHGFAGSEWSFHTTVQRPQPAVVAHEDTGLQHNHEDTVLQQNNGEATKEICVVDRTSVTATKARRSSTAKTASVDESTPATVVDEATTGVETQAHDKTPKASTASLDAPNSQSLAHPGEDVHSGVSRQSDLAVAPLTRNTIPVPSATQVFYDKPPHAPSGLYTPDGQPNPWYYPRGSAYQAGPHVNGTRAPSGHQGFTSYAQKHRPRQPSELPVGAGYGVSPTYFGLNGSRAPVTSTYDNGYARSNNYLQHNGTAAYGPGPVFVNQGQNRSVKPQYQQVSASFGGLPQQPAAIDNCQRVPSQSFGSSSTRDRRDTMSSVHSISQDPNCLNAHLRKMTAPSHQQNYVACPCEYCQAKDRTLYVGPFQPGELSSPDSERKILDAFSDFGEVENLTIVHTRTCAFVRYTRRSWASAHEAKRQLNGKIFDFCANPVRVNHAFGSQYSRPPPPHRNKRLNNTTLNEFDASGAARPAHTAKSFAGAPHGQANNALLAKQSALVPGVNDVLSHMHQCSAHETSHEGTGMSQSATLPGQGHTIQPAPKNDEETVTNLGTDNNSDTPVDAVGNLTMLDQSGGDTLALDNKTLSEDKSAVDIPNPDIEHDDIMDEQDGQPMSQLSSRTITPSPLPRDQESSSALVSPTDHASEQSLGEQNDQAFDAEYRTLDYGTVRRHLSRRAVSHQPIPMDWAAPHSGSSGNTCQATGHVDVSPSGVHNSSFAVQSVLSQDITPQSSPHRKKNGKGKSKAKQSQQKLHENSSNYMLPATFYQPQPTDAAFSQQLPSQTWNGSRKTTGASLNPQGFDLHNEHSRSPRGKLLQGRQGSGSTKHMPGHPHEYHADSLHSPSYFGPMTEKPLGYSTFGLTPPGSSVATSYTSPLTEPFPSFNDNDYQNMTPHVLNPAATEFVSPTRTSGGITKGEMPANAGEHLTAPLQLSPVVGLPTQPVSLSAQPSPAAIPPTSTAKPETIDAEPQGHNKEVQSEIKDFASPEKTQKSTADSAIPADKTDHAAERSDPTKKPIKHKQNKKAKSHVSQGQSTSNDHGEQGQKNSGNNKTQPSMEDKPASHANDKADKQQRDNGQKKDQSGNKDIVSKETNGKGKSVTKDVPANHPVVPGATWVDTSPKKATKKKNAKRHASKGKPTAKSASSSATSAPALSQESEVKREQYSGPQAANREGGSENKWKGTHKAGAKTQDGPERAATPAPKTTPDTDTTAPTGTPAEATKRENPTTQRKEAENIIPKESATKNQQELEVSSSTQAKKGKGKKQKSSAANQNAASQNKDQATLSAATQATTNEKAEAERRDTMVSLSQADLVSVLDESDKAALSSSGTKTPSLRDAPAPNSSPWRKDGKNKASDKKKEESTDVHPETLVEGEERKGG
ncbi:hypothetical protein PG984_010924 [Apiospora sp. TS-2023a]